MSDSLQDRGKAIEDVFFREKDQQLLDKLREEMAKDEDRAALAAASGISDKATLDALISNQVSPETVTAISLVPLVAVAWADNKMEASEVEAILKAAGEAGVHEGSASLELLQSWMAEKPGDELLEAWRAYVNSLRSTLEQAAFTQIGNSIMERANNVAKAAGGFLGMGSVSQVELDVLEDLAKLFA